MTFNGRLIRDHRPEKLFEAWFGPKDARLSNGRLRLILEATSPALFLAPLLLAGFLGLTDHRHRRCSRSCRCIASAVPVLRGPAASLHPRGGAGDDPAGRARHAQLEIVLPRAGAPRPRRCGRQSLGTCVIALPEVNPHHEDDPFPYPEMVDARESLIPDNVKRPALVFVTFSLDVKEIAGDQVAIRENVHSEAGLQLRRRPDRRQPDHLRHDLRTAECRTAPVLQRAAARAQTCTATTGCRAQLIPHGTVASEIEAADGIADHAA